MSVKMPNPVGYQWLDTAHFRKHLPEQSNASEFRHLITTDQAEAYANDRELPLYQALEVSRVALERICEIDRAGECESIAMDALSDIRALIPKDDT